VRCRTRPGRFGQGTIHGALRGGVLAFYLVTLGGAQRVLTVDINGSVHCRQRITSYLSDDLGDVVRNLGPMHSHLRKFGFGD
jgi:hypothetical protein